VVLASVTNSVVAGAHQLHGALGVCVDHPLWLSTLRAQSWIREFGSSNHHARKLGHLALSAREPWDVVIGHEVATPAEQSFDL
jgi:acyl-CoA dehydrogenase